MKVGTVCYATDSGLGILAKAFYDNGVVTDVAVIRHGRHDTHDEWYLGALQITDLRNSRQLSLLRDFCRRVDAMLFFETPFDWALLPFCREHGVRTFLMTMYECTHEKLPYQPDRFICPSLLDLRYFPPDRSTFIPVPVKVQWQLRERAEVFVHNAGHGGLKGRNGTKELLDAWKSVESPAQLIVRSQSPMEAYLTKSKAGVQCKIRHGTVSYDSLWEYGDVFIFPERFNGLSLPLQEARAAGMLVMCQDRFPMNTWLPTEPLIKPRGYVRDRIGPPYNVFDNALPDPVAIAAKIDEWFGRDITAYSLTGKKWAEEHSWEALKPRYLGELAK